MLPTFSIFFLLIRLQSNGLASLAFLLGIIIERLSSVTTTSNDLGKKSGVSVKSIPSSTIEFLLSCIEKHCGMKDEMKGIVVSWELEDIIP